MSFGFNSSSSSSSSDPVDALPKELQGIRDPYADLVEQILTGSKPKGGYSDATNVAFREAYDKAARQDMSKSEKHALKGQIQATSAIPSYTASTGQPMVAPITAQEQAMVDAIAKSATDPSGTTALVDQYLKGVIGGTYLPGQSGSNPFLKAAIEAAQRPTVQALEKTLDKTLPSQFTLMGQQTGPQSSSAFDRAAWEGISNTAAALGDIASEISYGAYESERARQQEAVGLSQTQVDTAVKQLQAVSLPRMIQDLGIERGLTEFQNRTNQLLQLLATITGTPLVETGQTTESETSSTGFDFGV